MDDAKRPMNPAPLAGWLQRGTEIDWYRARKCLSGFLEPYQVKAWEKRSPRPTSHCSAAPQPSPSPCRQAADGEGDPKEPATTPGD